MSNDGSHFNVVTIKYDSLLSWQWTDSIRGDTLYNEAHAIQIDASNNIYVGGYEHKNSGISTWLVAKYNNSGYLVWTKDYYGNYLNNDSAELMAMYIDTLTSNIYATGNIHNGSDRHIATVFYDSTGSIQWDKIYKPAGYVVTANDISENNNGDIYVTGVKKNGSGGNYTTFKYQSITYTDNIVNDTASKPWYVAHQLIINFDPDQINTTLINNKDSVYGILSDFVNIATIDSMNRVLGLSGDGIGSYTTSKIFKNLSTSDTIAISRTGDTVPILEKYWAQLLVHIPTGINEIFASDTLAQLSIILNAQPDYTFQLASSNDASYFSKQFSLHANGTYANADIHIDSAWQYFSVGDSNIKIGDYDSGLKFDHVDFGGPKSKVIGKDYVSNGVSIRNSNSKDSTGHGTATAGIMCAIRDNKLGIAGIAGGDSALLKPGCGLVAMKVTQKNAQVINSSDLATAILEGLYAPYSVNVINASWYNYITTNEIVRQQVKNAYLRNTVFVAAMGNDGVNSAAHTPAYPAALRGDWVIAVGASGIDGKFLDNKSKSVSGEDTFTSNYGPKLVDLIAPGDDHLVYTTSSASNSSYTGFGQTSASAAHVSAVAALILSYGRNYFGQGTNFSADDVQNILKDSITINGLGVSSFPDNKVGYGRLNATKALSFIEKGKFTLKHIERQPGNPVNASQVGTTSQLIDLHDELDTTAGGLVSIVLPGSYLAYVWKVTMTIPYTIKPHAHVLSCWARLNFYQDMKAMGRTLFDSNGTFIEVAPGYRVTSFTNSHAIVTGYLYKLASYEPGNSPLPPDTWLSTDATSAYNLNKLQASITIRTDEPQISGIHDEEQPDIAIGIYPNPANKVSTVHYDLPEMATVNLEVTDIEGRVLLNKNYGHQPAGENRININTENYSPGIYIVKLQINNGVYVDKFIKQGN